MSDILLPGTADLPDVLAGKSCTSSKGYKFTGTMTNNGAFNITPSNVSQAIPQGYHSGGGSVAAVVVPVANVLAGTTIAGQAGTMVNNGAGGNVTPGTANQTRAAGFWSSVITILGDVALIAANILAGKTIFGVAGTATADATAGAGDIANGSTAYVNGAKVTGTGANAKKYVSGNATSGSGTSTFTSDTGVAEDFNTLTVSGLNFPNGIAFIKIVIASGGPKITIYSNQNLSPTGNSKIMVQSGASAPFYMQAVAAASITNTGFVLPVSGTSTVFNYEVWGN